MVTIEEIEVGTKVYWKMTVGHRHSTIPGEIQEINEDVATIKKTNYNGYGQIVKRNIKTIFKSKKQ